MRAMILAAGRGQRLRPLTDHTPKPLLDVGGKSLLEYTLERLSAAGYREIVINLGHLGEQIPPRLGDGSRWGVRIHYSQEPPGALETAGGIRHALPWLCPDDTDNPFLVVNGDLWCDHPLHPPSLAMPTLAHLVLVPNPEHHPDGDFALTPSGYLSLQDHPRWTFSGIGWYRPQLFRPLPPGPRPLAPLLRAAIAQQQVTGTIHHGRWLDVGTPERLAALVKSMA